jgi:glycine/betaine/sarcosine/D-proline reductase family selenoprotein B
VGIPAVQISPVVDIAKMIGVSRLVCGHSITSPLGDPGRGPDKEKEMRRKYVEKALEALEKEGHPGEFLDIEK